MRTSKQCRQLAICVVVVFVFLFFSSIHTSTNYENIRFDSSPQLPAPIEDQQQNAKQKSLVSRFLNLPTTQVIGMEHVSVATNPDPEVATHSSIMQPASSLPAVPTVPGVPVVPTKALTHKFKPVLVNVVTGHFFVGYEREVPCPIKCSFRRGAAHPDANWFHAPSHCGTPPPKLDGVINIVMSMESAAYYKCLDRPEYMDKFQLKMTYNTRISHVPVTYLMMHHLKSYVLTTEYVMPFAEKRDAVSYIQSNCGAPSGRDRIVKEIMASGIKVDARGHCLNNAPIVPRSSSMRDAIRHYKFCIAIENSVNYDYITEKMWNALMGGCIPIVYGAPNLADYFPTKKTFIHVRDYTKDGLVKEIRRLMDNETAYNEYLHWRTLPLWQLSYGYQQLVNYTIIQDTEHTQCLACKAIAKMRMGETPDQYFDWPNRTITAK